MKRFFTLALFLFFSAIAFAQTDGITYQAVIIGPDVLELPGVDSEGNYLPVTDIAIKFSIIAPGSGVVEFTEIQNTTTDEFGRVNLIIGAANHDDFEKIDWNGTPKSLKVEIDFNNGDGFVDMSIEKLTYVPYVAHRDITASGTLDVDGDTFLNRELTVDGPTNLNSTLSVNGGNASSLTGDLTVDGATNLNSSLDVNNKSTTNLSGALNVGVATGGEDVDAPTVLNGTLNVVGKTTVTDFEATGQSTFNDLEANTLRVNTSTNLFGTVDINSGNQVRLTTTMTNAGNGMGNHPMLIDGGTNGLAIRVNGGRSNNTNFITFFDTTRAAAWGRIEGELPSEYTNNADYVFDQSSLNFDIYDSDVDLGFAIAYEVIAAAQLVKAAADFRGCVGLGGCLASPGPADIAFSGVELVSAAAQAIFATLVWDRARANKTLYDNNKDTYQGVTYASGSGDYAEYLLRADVNETMSYGDVVGVVGGKISKNTLNAERIMVVSYKPIVLGNMPQENREKDYEKVAFMGQVPVKVYGTVNIGDYIVPSGKNDGIAIAIAPSKITSKDISNIIGVAWEKSTVTYGFNMVNVAVGLNKNDNNPIVKALEEKVQNQAIEISNLKNEIAKIYELISGEGSNVAHANDAKKITQIKKYDDRKYEILDTDKGEIVYWEITKADFEKGLLMAEAQMINDGIDVVNHGLWKKIKNEPDFKEKLLTKVKASLDKQLHYHKTISKEGGH